MAKQKLFYFQAYDQRQQWQKGSLVAQSKQAAQFLLIAKGFNHIRLQQDCLFAIVVADHRLENKRVFALP